MIAFDDLNPNQRRAVDWRGGPLLVLAGSGSGKTVVLTLRIVRLLEESETASALALTFTNKAAAEMRDRVNSRLGGRTDRALLRTFHAFATDVLGQHGSHLGIRPDFGLLTRDKDRIDILEEVIRELPDGAAGLPPDHANLLHLIDRLFSESYGGDGRSSSLTGTPSWLPPLFRRYCEALVATNRLDFGSLLTAGLGCPVHRQVLTGGRHRAGAAQISTGTPTSIWFATSAYRSTSTSGARMLTTRAYRTARS